MSTRDFFRRNVLHNLGLKFIALALAVGLWLAVSSSPPSEVALNVALIFRNMPADLEISSEGVPTVQVRVRGPEAIVRRLQASDVRAEIDMTGVRPGERTFDLTHQVSVPNRLEISEVVPGEIHLAFDRRATRSVSVQPRITGGSGRRFKIVTEPPTVEITGPEKQLSSVASVTTDTIDITGVVGSLSVARHAYISDPLIQVTSPRVVRVTVTMESEAPQSTTQPK